ncbi:transcription factor Gibbin [Leucoraja erinacea]|uniref:transcription factor Gibbin n=1 Tax=Leucoraja erinaceus TaxID=7782 RepID=UPI0024548E23|nr:transcription factor Gibbin [Leucoraja erinacea]XP_055512616.1 transcription factor Gibbin [Leucoraja erinacea]
MASRRQAMDRVQRKDGADPCERSRHGEFGKFNAGVEALISPAVPNNTFFEDASASPDHRLHVHCESARDALLKHEQGERKLGALLGDTTCKKYALRNKPMVQYGLEQVEYERYYKAVSVPSVSAQACLDYGAPPRLPLKGTMLSRGHKYKCKGSRKMLVKLSRVNIEKYLLQAERKSKACHNSTGSGVKVQFISVPEGDSTATKKGRRNKVTLLPTGDVPVVKRKRGRPRKVVPEGGGEPANHVKRKPRHHKLSPPQPTYIAGCNDSAADYTDVLSKLAFLTKQSLILGRCSPPRCWSPSEPGSMQRSAALHHDMSHFYRTLAGTRRRGGKAGCSRGRQLGQLAESSSTFSDFFEGIGKRKRVFLGETKLYARKCKWGTEMKEKPVQRRKPYKRTPHFPEHGIFHGVGASGGDSGDWARQAGDSCWPGGPGYQAKQLRNGLFSSSSSSSSYPGMSGQSFPSAMWDARSVSRNGYLMGRLSTGQAGAALQSPASIAGYFRSLLDSDDSSDLMDVSFSQGGQETCGVAGGGGGSFGSTTPSRHLTHFQENFDKTNSPNCSQPAGGQSAVAAASYPLMGSENSDSLDYVSSFHSSETESFQRAAAQTTLPRQAGHSCQQACDNFGHFGNYRLRAQGFSGSDAPLQTSRDFSGLDFLGTRDCSFGFEASNTSQSSSSSSAATDQYTQHTLATKLHFNPSSPFNCSTRPDPRSPMSLQTPLVSDTQSDSACSMDHPSTQKYFGSTQLSSDGRMAFFRGLQLGAKSGFNLPEGCMAHFNHRYSPVLDYNSLNESKDILDISNYTPRKAKVRALPDTLAESSSHFNAAFGNADGGGGGNEEKSSLSSLEKLMLDWDETIPGERAGGKLCSKRQWNHHQQQQQPPFPSDARVGYGRRKRADMSSPPHMLFPASPPFLPRKTPAPRQARNTRSPSVSNKKDQAARKSKLLQKMPAASSPAFADAPDCALDYGYSGDTPVPTAHTYPVAKGEQKEFCGLYSPSCSRSMPEDTSYPVGRFAMAANDIGEAVSGLYPELKQGAGQTEQLQSMGQDHERLLPDTRELFPIHAPGPYGGNLDPTDPAKKLATFYDSLDNSTDIHPPTSRQLLATQLQFEAENASVLETSARYLQNSSAAYSSLEETKKDAELSSLFAMQRRNNIPTTGRPQNAVAQLEKQAQKLALDYGGSPYSSGTMAIASPASSDSSIHLDPGGSYNDKQGGRRVAPMGLLMDHGQEELYTGSASQ